MDTNTFGTDEDCGRNRCPFTSSSYMEREEHYRKLIAWRLASTRSFFRMHHSARTDALVPSREFPFLNALHMRSPFIPTVSPVATMSRRRLFETGNPHTSSSSPEYYRRDLSCRSPLEVTGGMNSYRKRVASFQSPVNPTIIKKRKGKVGNDDDFIELPSSPPRCPQEALHTPKHLSLMSPKLKLPSLVPNVTENNPEILKPSREQSLSSVSVGDELDVAAALCDMNKKKKSSHIESLI